jgi:hypothetical protein
MFIDDMKNLAKVHSSPFIPYKISEIISNDVF